MKYLLVNALLATTLAAQATANPGQGSWQPTLQARDLQGTGSGLANSGGFEGLQAANYWSGSGVAGNANYAWSYHFGLGYQSLAEKGVLSQAIALRDGDVLSAVPEPSSWVMAGAGLLCLGWLQRRRRQA